MHVVLNGVFCGMEAEFCVLQLQVQLTILEHLNASNCEFEYLLSAYPLS
jgi:hypothetical protein